MVAAGRSVSLRKRLFKSARLSVACVTMLSGISVVKMAQAEEAEAAPQPLISLPAANRTDKRNPLYDVGILNTLLNSEYEIYAVYREVGRNSFLGPKPYLISSFTAQHLESTNKLIEAITSLEGEAVKQKLPAQYTDDLKIEAMTKREDLVGAVLTLEMRLANAYIASLGVIDNKDIKKLTGRLIADSAMRYTALSTDVGRPLPRDILTFGK